MRKNAGSNARASGKPLEPKKPHLLPPGRSLTFGQSTRVFKLRDGGTGFMNPQASAEAARALAKGAAALEEAR